MDRTVQELNGFGLGRQDRIAVVVANGPEMATCFLGVSAAATCAPLNPGFRENEFAFNLEDLRARALIVEQDVDSPARAAAATLRLPILELVRNAHGPAGTFSLQARARLPLNAGGFAGPEDCALMLHTGGSTARPKRVPLSQANLCAITRNLEQTLALTPADCCLNVMPLFHIHGLVTAVLAALCSGGRVVCTPGFDAHEFFTWLAEFRPTWYTAVPTIHRAIQARAAHLNQDFRRAGLRVIRSTSASLPAAVLAELEATFGVPVLESYGLTEASHVCCNPLPPRVRKPGSVGVAAGAEVAIMDEAGQVVGPDTPGEIVIRGPNVTAGYEGDPSANAVAFKDGWFHSGDLGYHDRDGYFYLTGRLKEVINRGGEKILPGEVDEALLAHPEVAQAVTFAVPHARLGQDVAAAVVLRNCVRVTPRELRGFALQRLAAHKVPSQVIVVTEIPKSSIGKVQRLGLHRTLGHLLQPEFVPPARPVEETLACIWRELLGLERVGVHDNFFALGGDSLLATSLFREIEEQLGKRLPLITLLSESTIAELARILEAPDPAPHAQVIEIQPHGSRPPLFFFPSLVGDIWYPRAIVKHLSPDQPVFGIQPNHDQVSFASIEQIAAEYVEVLRRFQSRGPYHLGGYSFAGLVAFEAARQLTGQGESVAFLAVIDTAARPLTGQKIRPRTVLRNSLLWFADDLLRTPPGEVVARVRRWLAPARNGSRGLFSSASLQQVELESLFPVTHLPTSYRQAMENNFRAAREYVCKPYPGRLTILRARTRPLLRPLEADLGWTRWAQGGIDVHVIPGHHGSILREPYVRPLASRLQAALRRASRSTRAS